MEYKELSPDLKLLWKKVSDLETHIINLIHPIQRIENCFAHTFGNLLKEFEKIIKQLNDTHEFISKSENFNALINKLEQLKLQQAFDEIKYIGNRLKKIEEEILKISSNSQKKDINLEIRLNDYEMVKKPIHYSENELHDEPIENLKKVLAIFSAKQADIIIHKLGLFGEKSKTYKEIGNLLNISSSFASSEFQRAIWVLKNKKNRHLVEMLPNGKLKEMLI